VEAYFAFVKKVVEAFGGAGLDYAFTGALATSFYGTPRTTSDIDVIVTIGNETDLKTKLITALRRAGLAVDERKIDSALTLEFKIATFKDTTSPYCIDVIFSSEKLDKRAGKIAGLNTFFQSPEGLIAAKLRMIKATLSPERSAKDKTDIKAILKIYKSKFRSGEETGEKRPYAESV
jgi:predicted nucleotidyltransferase